MHGLAGASGSIDLPADWSTKTLRELCLKTSLIDPVRVPDREFEYVDVSSVSADRLCIVGTAKVKGPAAPSRARKLLQEGDVIFATVRPTLRRVALVPPNLAGQLASTAFCVIRANPDLADPRFLYYAAITEDFIKHVGALERGASYPAVTDGNVMDQKIVVPSLPEQCAIAGVLSKLQAAVEVQDRMTGTLKELKEATMAKLFREGLRGVPLKQTEIGEIPESWQVVPLVELFSIRYGMGQPPRSDPNGIPMIRATDVKRGRIVPDRVMRIDRSSIPKGKDPYLRQGDIIVVRSGAYTGDVAEYRGPWDEAVAGYDLVLSPAAERVESAFIAQYLLTDTPQAYFRSTRGRAAQPHLNADQLGATRLPVPCMGEQREIAQFLNGLDRSVTVRANKLRTAASLFSGFLDQVMTGRLRMGEKR